MQNLTISNFFGAREFHFGAKFAFWIFRGNFDSPWRGKSRSLRKIQNANLAPKWNSRAPKKFEMIKFCIFVWKFCFFLVPFYPVWPEIPVSALHLLSAIAVLIITISQMLGSVKVWISTKKKLIMHDVGQTKSTKNDKISNLMILQCFDVREFCFCANFDVPFVCQNFHFPRQGKSIHSQKNGASKVASKQNLRASKNSKIIKFYCFWLILNFCFSDVCIPCIVKARCVIHLVVIGTAVAATTSPNMTSTPIIMLTTDGVIKNARAAARSIEWTTTTKHGTMPNSSACAILMKMQTIMIIMVAILPLLWHRAMQMALIKYEQFIQNKIQK